MFGVKKVLFLLIPSIDLITAASTMFGKKFLVSFPRMLHYYKAWPQITPQVYFLLTSRHMKLQVSIKTAWTDSSLDHLEMKVDLTYTNPAKYVTIPKDYHYRANIGIQYTFSVMAIQDFTLAVVLFDDPASVAVFRALPVDGWGKKYFAVTLGLYVTLIIVANEGPNTVTVKLRADNPELLFRVSYVHEYRNGNEFDVTLLSLQAYVFSTCNLNVRLGSITGTEILGHKTFGVISGNCEGHTRSKNCQDGRASTDAASEMLMPYDSYGKDFLVFYMEGIDVFGYFIVVASKPSTALKFYVVANNENERHLLANASESLIILMRISRLSSNKGIQVMFVSRSTCKRSVEDLEIIGDPSLCLIVPTNLFYYIYMWRPPTVLKTKNYAVIIIKKNDIQNLLLNGQRIARRTDWREIPGTPGWRLAHLEADDDVTYTIFSNSSTFGCYLYGYAKGTSYSYPAGYISTTINRVCEMTIISALPGDLIDNDCDRKIDEEIYNGIDDDNDQRIDEDLNAHAIVTTTTRIRTDATTALVSATTAPVSARTALVSATTELISNETALTVHDQTSGTTPAGMTQAATAETQATTAETQATTAENQATTAEKQATTFKEDAQMSTTEELDAETYVTTPPPESNVTSPEAPREEDPVLFSNWSQWHCDRDCQDPRQLRKRVCFKKNVTSICGGPTIVWRNSNCYMNTTCPTDCPLYKWGVGCTRTCENCLHDCDKFNGSCDACKPGFKNGHLGCIEDCDVDTFGLRCEGNCLTKCGGDCEERVNGTCYDTGEYSEWSMWACTRTCTETRMYRTRLCLKPSAGGDCPGVLEDWQPGDCYKYVTCPTDCPPHRWDVNCSSKCDNCKSDCNKFNGSCDACNPGFHLPKHSCIDVCPVNKYGDNCNGNCLEVCGADCMDKATGACYMIGVYGEWEQWHCALDCLNPNMIRKRHCNAPTPGITCLGKNEESRMAHCYAGKMCPKQCPLFKWGIDCVKSCANCHSECDKFTGVCDFCKPGYKMPDKGCPFPCDPLEYGVNCVGDCFDKCGDECFSAVTGECKSAKWKYLLLLAILTALPCCYLLCKRKIPDDVLSESSWHSKNDLEIVDKETKDDEVATDERSGTEHLTLSEGSKKSTEV